MDYSINVKDAPYNAKGDGVTDDQPAIQAAINAAAASGGGTVVLPAGTYRISTSIYINGLSNITLTGTSSFGTTIAPDFTSGTCINLYNSLGYKIKNLVLQAPPNATGLVGIYCRIGAFKGFIDTFQILDFNIAIQVDTNINDLLISNGIIESSLNNNFGIRISADSPAYQPPGKDPWQQRIDIIQIRSVTINQGEQGPNNTVIPFGTGIYAGQGLNTLRLDNVGLINNIYGLVATAPNPATIAGPYFIFANDLEIDFSQAQNIYLDQGIMFVGSNLYLQGAGGGCVDINPGFTQTAITTSRLEPNEGQNAINSQTDSVTVSTSIVYGNTLPSIITSSGIIYTNYPA